MATASTTMGLAVSRAREREVVSDPFSPDVPLTWRYGRLRYADDREAYRLTWWREWFRRLWHDRGKQPIVSEDPRKVFNDERQTYNSYADARVWCHTPNCYVVAMPHGGRPLGDELFDNPTFIRPEIEPERDREFAARYTMTLADFICPALAAENKALHQALGEMKERLRLLAGDA